MMSPQPADQIRLLTGRFHDLQGLQRVPFGILLLLFAGIAWSLPATPQTFPKPGSAAGLVLALTLLVVVVVGFALALGATKAISARYRQSFGHVELARRRRTHNYLLAMVGTVAITAPIYFDAKVWFASGHALPVNVVVLVLAAAICFYWHQMGRSLHYYLVIAGVGIGLGIASAAGLPPATWPWHLREALLFAGAATIAGGVLDHQALQRAMPQPSHHS